MKARLRGCLGPNARAAIQKIADEPEAWTHENFPFAALHELRIKGVPVLAFRISCVGEQGWELHFKYEDGLALWDALHALGVTPVGVEAYTASIAFGPTIGKNIALAYLPHAYCQVGRELQIQYFADVYPVRVEAVGYKSMYDPDNIRPRS